MWNDIKYFFKSFSFYSGILKTIAVLLCLLLGWLTGHLNSGVIAGLTIVMISPSDIPGNRKHHLGGIAIATIFVMISMVCIQLTKNDIWVLLPLMAVLIFVYAYVSLYGFRASMVAIAGIFSVALTFAQNRSGIQILYDAFVILSAGLGYILLVQIHLLIKPRHYSEQLLGKCMHLTADFIKTRATLLTNENRDENQQKLLNLQIHINESYEKLREVLLNSQSKSGKTNYLQRQFLIFIELVDIFEYALANPIPYQKLDIYFSQNKKILNQYADFLTELSSVLLELSKYIESRKKITMLTSVESIFGKWKSAVEQYLNDQNQSQETEPIKAITHLYQYTRQQCNKIEQIVQIFANYYTQELSFRDEKTFRRFVSVENYSLKRLTDHWSVKSPIFLHALRLAIVTIIGYAIGHFFALQNSYWILFTIYVIMRPGYAVTKKRSKDRIVGTIIGAVISAVIIYVCQYVLQLPNYHFIYAIIVVLCMPFAYGLLQENFSLCVVFITIYIMMIYAIYVPDAIEVLKYRVIDTMVGVGLSIFANHFIFPSWEHKQYNQLIVNSLKSNIQYMNEVLKRYDNPVYSVTDYKVARKNAFLSLANLNAGLQRMLQEPKSQQKNYAELNDFIVLQQDFLSTLSAMALQLTSVESQLPKSVFILAMLQIQKQIENSLKALEKISVQTAVDNSISSDFSFVENQQYICYEQLNYLYTLSEKMENRIKLLANN